MNIHYFLNLFTIINYLFVVRNVICESTEDNKQYVSHLTEKTFIEFIQSNKLVLVMFHSPECIYCLQLSPIINEVAKILHDKPDLTEVPVKIAFVDLKKEPNLGYKFVIQKTPELKFFRDFHIYPYDGPRKDAKCKLSFFFYIFLRII